MSQQVTGGPQRILWGRAIAYGLLTEAVLIVIFIVGLTWGTPDAINVVIGEAAGRASVQREVRVWMHGLHPGHFGQLPFLLGGSRHRNDDLALVVHRDGRFRLRLAPARAQLGNHGRKP